MQKEEQRAVVDARQARPEAAVETELVVLLLDELLLRLPFDAEGRIGHHVVEGLAGVAVAGFAVAERIAVDDIIDGLVLDEHVGAADGVGLGVVVLAEQCQVRLVVVLADVFLGDREHAACAAGRVIDRARDSRHVYVLVAGVDEVRHQADDFAGREVVSGLLVRLLVEAPDQVLEDVAHGDVVHPVGVEVDGRELPHDLIQPVRLVELLDLLLELELLEDFADLRREALDVGGEVPGEAVGVPSSFVNV